MRIKGRKIQIALLLLVVGSLLVGCPEPTHEPSEPDLRVQAVCSDGVVDFELYVDRRITSVGPSSNALALADSALWVVESGANSISRFDLERLQMEPGFIHVGGDRNPYDIDVDESSRQIWVSNFAASTITVADMDDGQILAEIDDEELNNPSALVLTEDYAYVSDVNYLSVAEGFGPGSIVVVDRSTYEIVARWETAFENPQFAAVEEIDGQAVLLVSSSGALEIGEGGARVKSEGGLEWYDLGVDPLQPPAQAYPLGQAEVQTVGAVGRALLRPDEERLYFVSAIAPVLFVFDIPGRQWLFDAEAPLQLYEAEGDATHYGAMGADGLLWVSAFNDDALYLFDTSCDQLMAGPIDVGEAAHMLEGVQAIRLVARPRGVDGYFLMSIANKMGRLRLEYTGESS